MGNARGSEEMTMVRNCGKGPSRENLLVDNEGLFCRAHALSNLKNGRCAGTCGSAQVFVMWNDGKGERGKDG
eukprot:3835063-Amphidinium_carterae.6